MKQLALAIAVFFSPVIPGQELPTYQVVHAFGIPGNGSGRPAVTIPLVSPGRIAGDSDGNVFVSFLNRVYRIDVASGIYTLAAGSGRLGAGGDGGPATEAELGTITGLAAGGGALYIAENNPCNIRRVDLDTGIVTKAAGINTCPAVADPDPFAGPVASTAVNPQGIAVDAQGRLLFASNRNRVGRIDFETGMIELIAGNGGFGIEGDGGPAADAQLGGSASVASDPEGNIYIAEFNLDRIRKVEAATGNISVIAGTGTEGYSGDGGPAVEAEITNPVALGIDSTGTKLYFGGVGNYLRVVDLSTGIIDLLAGGQGGSVFEDIPALQAGFNRVGLGIWVNPAGEVVFSDNFGFSVLKLTTEGIVTRVGGRPLPATVPLPGDGGPAQASPQVPFEVLVTADDRVLTSGPLARIQEVKDGVVHTIAGNGVFSSTGDDGPAIDATLNPLKMASDDAGAIYVVDTLQPNLPRRISNGTIVSLGTNIPGTAGLAVNGAGTRLYRSGNNQVMVEDFVNFATVFAGTGTAGFSGDGGPATEAQLNTPLGMDADADGNLYIADLLNNRVRMVDAATGIITTIAGNGAAAYTTPTTGPPAQVATGTVSDVAVDARGNVFFAGGDSLGNAAVFRLDRASNTVHLIAGGPGADVPLTRIRGLDVDSRGIVYVADTENSRVLALIPSDLEGPYITGAITPGAFGAGDTLAPGAWLEVYGLNFSDNTTDWGELFSGNMAPTTIGGVGLMVNGAPAAMSLLSPGQVNGQAGDSVVPGNAAIQLITAEGESNILALNAQERAGTLLAPPSFAAGGKQYVTAIFADGAFAGPPDLIPGANFRRAKAGDKVVLYGVGFGDVTPAAAPGLIVSGATALPDVTVTVGGVEAPVDFAGLTQGLIGLYQFNIEIPAGVTGDVLLEITVDGTTTTQVLYIALE